jgi:hypothetical protein
MEELTIVGVEAEAEEDGTNGCEKILGVYMARVFPGCAQNNNLLGM